MSKLNLSSLGELKPAGKRPQKPTIVSLLIVILLLGLFFGFFFILIVSFAVSPIFAVLIVALLAVFMKKASDKRKRSMKNHYAQLVADNGWTDNVTVPEEVLKSFSFLNNGSTKAKGIKGQINDHDFWMLYDEGGTLLIIDTGKQLPTAHFLNSIINSGIAKSGFDAMLAKDGLEHISLEGDFDKHFTLYAKPEDRTIVLSLVAPDLMDKILTTQGVSSVIFSEKYFALSSYSASNENTRSLLEAGETLLKEINS